MLVFKQGQPGCGAEAGAVRNTSAGSLTATLLAGTGLLIPCTGTSQGENWKQIRNTQGATNPAPAAPENTTTTVHRPARVLLWKPSDGGKRICGLFEVNEVTYQVGAGEHPVLQAALSHTGQGQGKQTPSRKQAASQPLQHHSLDTGVCQLSPLVPISASPAFPQPTQQHQHHPPAATTLPIAW